ncbi:MAG: hypothetical protein LBO63_01685 [Oscillospiraceae bacterium]|nr:hypothetical protein [Oscillospiraceae bacterium]
MRGSVAASRSKAPAWRAVTFSASPEKVTKKGATSLEEAIFFLYGNCRGGNKDCACPRHVLRWLRRTLALCRTQGRSLSRRWMT